MARLVWGCLSTLYAVLLTPPPLWGADHWLGPPGPPNGATVTTCSSSNPLPWMISQVQQIIRDNPKDPSAAGVTLILKPGTYVTGSVTLPANTPPQRRLVIRAETGGDPPVLRYQVPGTAIAATADPCQSGCAHLFVGPAWESWLFDLFGSTLARFEARDLVLDANWPAWAAVNTAASPPYVDGFALGALRVRGKEGLVKNVRVKNCGANGITPWPHWRPAGRECFPLWVDARDYGADKWVVEDCEVSDFHALHAGYCTAIMVTTVEPPNGLPSLDRVATVRRCQVRGWGPEIAFGTARSSQVAFRDNLVVGTALGLNCDTEPIRNVDFKDSLFLDVCAMAQIGAANSFPSTAGDYGYSDVTLSGNAVRLRAVPLLQNYRSYEWRSVIIGSSPVRMPVTDPALAVGRYYTGYCAGIKLAGAHDVSLHDNIFTTRPARYFFEPDPANTSLAAWIPAFRPSPDDPLSGLPCDQTGSVSVGGNWTCGLAMDFGEFSYLSWAPTIFHPALPGWGLLAWDQQGRVGRVLPSFAPTGQLVAAREVRVKSPERLGSVVCVEAAIVVHHHVGGIPWGASTLDTPGPNDLRLEVRRAGGQTTILAPSSLAGASALFTYTPEATPGRDELVIYGRVPSPSGIVPTDPDQTAWTVAEYPRHPVVRFERCPDVADDRRLSPGYLRLSRSGPVSANLAVTLIRLGAGFPRPTTVGNGLDDFLLCQPSAANSNVWEVCPANGDAWTVTLPAGQRERLLRLVPSGGTVNQDKAEYEAAYFGIEPSLAHAYGVGAAAAGTTPAWTVDAGGTAVAQGVAVTFWDGPKWRLYQLANSYQPAAPPPAMVAVGDAAAVPDWTEKGGLSPDESGVIALDPEESTGTWPLADTAPLVTTRTGEIIDLQSIQPLEHERPQSNLDDGSQRYAPLELWTGGAAPSRRRRCPVLRCLTLVGAVPLMRSTTPRRTGGSRAIWSMIMFRHCRG